MKRRRRPHLRFYCALSKFTCPFDSSQAETKGTALIRNADETLNFTICEDEKVSVTHRRVSKLSWFSAVRRSRNSKSEVCIPCMPTEEARDFANPSGTGTRAAVATLPDRGSSAPFKLLGRPSFCQLTIGSAIVRTCFRQGKEQQLGTASQTIQHYPRAWLCLS